MFLNEIDIKKLRRITLKKCKSKLINIVSFMRETYADETPFHEAFEKIWAAFEGY